jgi:recombination protein RecT
MSDENQNKAIIKAQTDLRLIMRSDQTIQRFEEITGKGNAGGYISSVLIAVAQSDNLIACSPNSIIGSALRAATMRLSVDPEYGHAYLVPYKGKCTLIVGYKGIYQLALRTNEYRYINLVDIYEGDELVINRITGDVSLKLETVTVRLENYKREGKITGHLLAFELKSGFRKTFFMTSVECDEHGAKYSPNYYDKEHKKNKASLWHKDPVVMHRKTVMRLGLKKWGYLDPFAMAVVDQEQFEDEVDFVDKINIEELREKEQKKLGSVSKMISDLGFPEEHPVIDVKPEEKKPEVKKADVKQQEEPVHIVTSQEYWTAVKEKGMSNMAGQDILTKQGGDYNAALHELKK